MHIYIHIFIQHFYFYIYYRNKKNMVWYFNFCSPHLTDDENVNLNRTLLVIELLLAMFITFIVHMLAELYDQESSRVKNQADPPQLVQGQDKNFEESAVSFNKNSEKAEDMDIEKIRIHRPGQTAGKGKKDEPGFFRAKKVFFLTVQTVQNKSPCFFGHFAIAIAACAMYSPFFYQSGIGIIYIISVVLALIFQAWKYERLLVITIGISYICNIGLITSAVVGVGMSNWDPYQIICYYSKLGM